MQDEVWFCLQEIKSAIFYARGYREVVFSRNLTCVLYGGKMYHVEVNVDSAVYSRFPGSKLYWFHKWIFSGGYSKRGVGNIQ